MIHEKTCLVQCQNPRVAVIGSGAVGLLVFAKLAQLHQEALGGIFSKLVLICRTDEVARRILRKGGVDVVRSGASDASEHLSAIHSSFCALDAPELEVLSHESVPATAVDLALVCVKSYQVDSIASFLGRSLANNNKDAVVVTFCNGIGHLPRLASLLPPRVAILPAVTYMAAERLEAGTVKVHGYGSTYLLGSRGSRRGQPTNLSLNNRHMRQHPEPASFQEITNERGKRPTLGDSVVIRTAEAEHAQQASQELWLQALAEEKKHIPQQEQRPPPGKEPAAAVRSIQWTSPWIVCPELNAVQWHLVNERQGLCAWMNRAGIGPASVGEDTQPFIEKLAINCGINPVATLLRVRNGVLKDLPDALRLAELAAQEVAALFGLPEQAIKQRLRAVLQATSGNVNSMLADMQRGQPTEIDALNGAVASLQAAKGEHLPSVNAVLAALVRAMSQRFQQKHP